MGRERGRVRQLTFPNHVSSHIAVFCAAFAVVCQLFSSLCTLCRYQYMASSRDSRSKLVKSGFPPSFNLRFRSSFSFLFVALHFSLNCSHLSAPRLFFNSIHSYISSFSEWLIRDPSRVRRTRRQRRVDWALKS